MTSGKLGFNVMDEYAFGSLVAYAGGGSGPAATLVVALSGISNQLPLSLYSIDQASGAATVLASDLLPSSSFASLYGAAFFDSGNLYVPLETAASQVVLAVVDLSTNSITSQAVICKNSSSACPVGLVV